MLQNLKLEAYSLDSVDDADTALAMSIAYADTIRKDWHLDPHAAVLRALGDPKCPVFYRPTEDKIKEQDLTEPGEVPCDRIAFLKGRLVHREKHRGFFLSGRRDSPSQPEKRKKSKKRKKSSPQQVDSGPPKKANEEKPDPAILDEFAGAVRPPHDLNLFYWLSEIRPRPFYLLGPNV